MRVGEIVNNPKFDFNAPFRVTRLVVGAIPKLDKHVALYDSTVSPDFPFDLEFATIAGINSGKDGVLEIEIDW